MPKAVLVMGMPKSCTECIVCNLVICRAAHELVPLKGTGRPDWCPLRELPEKATDMPDADDLGVDYVRGTMDGWNNCLEKIAEGT